jgi:hypothetical protein
MGSSFSPRADKFNYVLMTLDFMDDTIKLRGINIYDGESAHQLKQTSITEAPP